MKYWLLEMYLSICSWSIWHWRIRKVFYKLVGISIGRNSSIHSGCVITGKRLYVGENSYINRRCMIDCKHGNITIGNYVGVAYDVKLYTTNHEYSVASKRTGKVKGDDIVIKDGSWIGGGTIICPGVVIEKGVVIAAGSVVTKNCDSNCLYGGNPARKIRVLNK